MSSTHIHCLITQGNKLTEETFYISNVGINSCNNIYNVTYITPNRVFHKCNVMNLWCRSWPKCAGLWTDCHLTKQQTFL